MESIISSLLNYLSFRDKARLCCINNSTKNIINYYNKRPNDIGYCFFCGKSTLWYFDDNKTHCCPKCLKKYENDIMEYGFKMHLVRKTI